MSQLTPNKEQRRTLSLKTVIISLATATFCVRDTLALETFGKPSGFGDADWFSKVLLSNDEISTNILTVLQDPAHKEEVQTLQSALSTLMTSFPSESEIHLNETSAGDDQNRKGQLTEPSHPRVKKFMENIYYDQYYNESAVYDYIQAFYEGYNLQDYEFAEECLDSTSGFVSVLHEFHLNMTRRFDWSDPYFLIFQAFGVELNDSWFYCYQWAIDMKVTYETKIDNFVDFGDVYLSFIFNLLAKSLHIKNASENIIEANLYHDTGLLMRSVGQILRIILDFSSTQSVQAASLYSEEALTQSGRNELNVRQERKKMSREQQSEIAKDRLKDMKAMKKAQNLQIIASDQQDDEPAEGEQQKQKYKWRWFDYLQSPLAFIIGGLHALPDESFGYSCSKNITSSRTYLFESFEYFNISEDLEGVTSLHESLSYVDDMGVNCYFAVVTDLSEDHWLGLVHVWYEIPLNLVFNLGYFWVDVINWLFYSPETVPQGDWAFFLSYLVGDMTMRIFYRDETP